MGVRVAFGDRKKIESSIRSNIIPRDSIIITNNTKESELFFYDIAGTIHTISEKKQFNSIPEAEAWIADFPCQGHILSIFDGENYTPYIVTKDSILTPLTTKKVSPIFEVSDEFKVSDSGELSVNKIDNTKIDGLAILLSSKVDKEDGKSLSSNDFTNELKSKLDFIPVTAEENKIDSVHVNDTVLDVINKTVIIPKATNSSYGVVIGSNEENKMNITSKGVIEVNTINLNNITQSLGDELILKCNV